MNPLRHAVAEALRISQERRDSLRRAVESGDPQVVFETVRRLLGMDDSEALAEPESHRPSES